MTDGSNLCVAFCLSFLGDMLPAHGPRCARRGERRLAPFGTCHFILVDEVSPYCSVTAVHPHISPTMFRVFLLGDSLRENHSRSERVCWKCLGLVDYRDMQRRWEFTLGQTSP